MEGGARRRAYFWLMGSCVALIMLAWYVVRLWSTTLAVLMTIVAAVIPSVAVIVGNWGALRNLESPAGQAAFRDEDPDS